MPVDLMAILRYLLFDRVYMILALWGYLEIQGCNKKKVGIEPFEPCEEKNRSPVPSLFLSQSFMKNMSV